MRHTTKHHHLEIEPQQLNDIVDNRKQFIARKNDSDYQIGDSVSASDGKRYVSLIIKYVSNCALEDGYTIFGFYHISGGLVEGLHNQDNCPDYSPE